MVPLGCLVRRQAPFLRGERFALGSDDSVHGVFADDDCIDAATHGGLSIAQRPEHRLAVSAAELGAEALATAGSRDR